MHQTGQQICFSVLIYLKKTLKHITLAQVLRCLLSSKWKDLWQPPGFLGVMPQALDAWIWG